MAFAIIGGLAVATVLTLIFLPALYVAWFRISEPDPKKTVSEPAPPISPLPEPALHAS
jgi:hypothetical protein